MVRDGVVSYIDTDWRAVREQRDYLLSITDWWALKDLTMSQEKKDYRKFLRDLPQDYENANAAADALNERQKPE
jgi:hypothetical protein|tara:strand:- start:87 stop:308 length:222 start_codon:yes stop_codon:yes gene_type:complete